MRNVKKILMGAAMAAAAVVFGGSTAQANSIILADVSQVEAPLGTWTYTYTVSLVSGATSASAINSGTASPAPAGPGTKVTTTEGDFFNLVDFAGLIPGSETIALATAGLAGWVVLESTNGLWPTNGTIVGDTLGLPNVTFQYVGTNAGAVGLESLINPAGFPSLLLGTVSVKSTISPGVTNGLKYTGQDAAIDGGGVVTEQSNQGQVTGPALVPVPSAVWAGGLLLSGLVVRRIRRGK